MHRIDNQSLCKWQIIESVITTNKNSNYNFFYEESKLLQEWIYSLPGDNFFKALVLFNFYSYSGYFALSERRYMIDIILNDDQASFVETINEWQSPHLNNEMLAHNLWLARMIYSNQSTEYKYLVQAYKDTKADNKIINFKNKIGFAGKIYDLQIFLKAYLENKITFTDKDEQWLLTSYPLELEIIKNFLEEELTSEVADESIEN